MAALDINIDRNQPRIRSLTRTKRWLITCAATLVSTYALDAIATAAGLILVTSSFLNGIGHVYALLFLASTYFLWAAGLRVNLRANWGLLGSTGTSTNVLSKIAYDLVRLRISSARVQRIAADAGYVCMEFAKELPYYAGAFGAALLTDSISSNEAIVFLGGANLGAAVYEYGLARLVRRYILNAPKPAFASFDLDWNARQYLDEYYDHIEKDELKTIEFFVTAIRETTADEPVLLFGVGPTLHHVFLTATTASEIHLGDYLESNLVELRRWLQRDESAHNWQLFVRYTLECEGIKSPTSAEIAQRENLVRQKTSKLLLVDVRKSSPLGRHYKSGYGTVVSAYCADSATSNKKEWLTYMKRIISLVRPGGTFVTAALRTCKGYQIGGKTFPGANVTEEDLYDVLLSSFDGVNIEIKTYECEGTLTKGYTAIILAYAKFKCN